MSIQHKETIPDDIKVYGAKVNNLKNIDVSVPLNAFVAITGVSGSGKSSLAMGTLYAEGARRYLNALSTYTRRRIGQDAHPNVTKIEYLPSAIALRQRPTVPGNRSTVGTMSEGLNVLRLMFSRLGSYTCPNGHTVPPTIKVAQAMDVQGHEMGKIKCPTCGVKFAAPSAESFAFNAEGACKECQGTGKVRQILKSALIEDENETIEQGAVASWHLPGRNFMPSVAREVGIRIDIPFKDLTDHEKDLVFNGPANKYQISMPSRTGRVFNLNAKYENAFAAVEDSMKTTKNPRSIKRLNRFYEFGTCPRCHGARFDPDVYKTKLMGKNIAEVSDMSLLDLIPFMDQLAKALPNDMHELATSLINEFKGSIKPLYDLGLDYLTLSRAGNTLSTGELQRIQLGRTLRSQTTGVLYVLDEPSVGLHAANVAGLINILHQLVSQGNSLVVVDHNIDIIAAADYIIEIGPKAGRLGGQVIDYGTPAEVKQKPNSIIAPFLKGQGKIIERPQAPENEIFKHGQIDLHITKRHNLSDVGVKIPKNRLTVFSGYSGAGKSTLVMGGLVTAMQRQANDQPLPDYIDQFNSAGLSRVIEIDSVPIGKNVRSTVATYCGIWDSVRKLFASTPLAKRHHWNEGHFSYNVKDGACPNCQGTGTISLDVQYLPDMTMTCPVCHGKRYAPDTLAVKWHEYSIADILGLSVVEAEQVFKAEPKILNTLEALDQMGLGYLILGESTPILSGGEAQRLKLVSQMGRKQDDTLFVFDEPSVGLHPKDVEVLNQVFQQLIDKGATLAVIEHDLDVIMNADYVIDLGPKGGNLGGKVVATGTPADIARANDSQTGIYLAKRMKLDHLL
ncbi:excinuclease ABC subunit UvrA [Lactobacillus sp. Sy-1]|uniref:excinuclease ABC subunit UvrA n=1 Tax=Lactobacillus sp. Sy-1 TaxID=2109645 RepID=UPI001C5933A6|nr:excinuclease ABC subunit UvrA [Lactobacillus sp. Sy-1]MBW1605008.1 excinuclease ABC subunit UvrA [Lactobacillus sp. Sy-1]